MRNRLIESLALMWREAETEFLKTEDDEKKFEVLEYQEKKKLTEEELEELNNTLSCWGI